MKLIWIRQCLGLATRDAKEQPTEVEKHTSQQHLVSNNRAHQSTTSPAPESKQELLLLHGPKQEYALVKDGSIPQLQNEREMLIKVTALGLNPIDWKAPYDP